MPEDINLEEQVDNEVTESNGQEPINLIEQLGLTEIPVHIPIDFLFVYNKLLLLMVELGESMLLNCNALCSKQNMPIVECYHMFKAALAAKQLASSYTTSDNTNIANHYAKLANTLLNYVKAQLNCIANNYSNELSFTLPLDESGSINLFITTNNNNTEVIVQPYNGADINIIKLLLGIVRDIVSGSVVFDHEIGAEYGLTEEEVDSHRYWHVDENNEFVPGSSVLFINGVKYLLDDDDYEEWIVTENGVSKGVGVILLTGEFDNLEQPDEVYVEADLLTSNRSN